MVWDVTSHAVSQGSLFVWIIMSSVDLGSNA